MEFEYDPISRNYFLKDKDICKWHSPKDIINPEDVLTLEDVQEIIELQKQILFTRNYYEEPKPYKEIEPFIVVYRSKPIKRNSFKINREKP